MCNAFCQTFVKHFQEKFKFPLSKPDTEIDAYIAGERLDLINAIKSISNVEFELYYDESLIMFFTKNRASLRELKKAIRCKHFFIPSGSKINHEYVHDIPSQDIRAFADKDKWVLEVELSELFENEYIK